MFISFRKAADLSFQIVLSVCVVVTGMSIAVVTAKGEEKPVRTLDVSQSVLWTSGPVYVDRHENLFKISVRSAASASLSDDICSDAIGLRVTCELIVPDHNRG